MSREARSFDDIFQGDEGKKAYYMFLVPELYNALMGRRFPEDKDVFTILDKAEQSRRDTFSVHVFSVRMRNFSFR